MAASANKRAKQARGGVSKRDPLPAVVLPSVGRPALYKPEYAELGKRAAMLGARNADLARFFGVSGATIDKWLLEEEQFSCAVREGKDHADAHVAEAVFKNACGYSHPAVKIFHDGGEDGVGIVEAPYVEHYPPNAIAGKFWLTNRRPDLWRDRMEFDNKGAPLTQINNDNRTQTIVNVNVDDAAKSYQDLISRTRK